MGQSFIALSSASTLADVIRLASPVTVDEFARFLCGVLLLADALDLTKVVVDQPLGDGIEIGI